MSARWFFLPWLALVLWVGLAHPLGSYGLGAPGGIALSILLVAAYLWVTEAVPLFVTSFGVLGLSLVWLQPGLRAAGIEVPDERFLAPFFSDLVLLFLGGFVLAAALSRYQLDKQLAQVVLRRAGTSVPRVTLVLMAFTATLSMWLSNTAATALMLGLSLPLLDRLPEAGEVRKTVLLSIPLAANVGGLGTPIGTPPNAIVLEYLEASGHPISFARWLLIGLPAVVVMLGVIWLLLLRMFGGRGVELAPPTRTSGAPVPGTPRGRRVVIVVSAVTVLGWLLGDTVGLSAGSVSLLPVTVFFGARLLSLADFRGLSWDVLVLMGGGLCLARVMDTSGLAVWIVGLLPTDTMGAGLLMATFLLVATAMSTVMSNTATANLLAPVAAGLSGVSHSPIFLALAFGCSFAMALPISTPPNAMAFGTGLLEAKDLLRIGRWVTVLGVAFTLTLFSALWKLLGVVG